MAHFIDEENIMTYVDSDCAITFYTEAPAKLDTSTENRNRFPVAVKNPNASEVMINITVFLMKSLPLKPFLTFTL